MQNELYDFRVIRALRKRWGLTLEQLALKADMAYSTVVAVESNKTYPSLQTLDAIALALQVSTSQLIRMAEQQHVQKRKLKPLNGQLQTTAKNTPLCHLAQFGAPKIFHIIAKANEVVEVMELHDDVYEFCYVLKGIVQLHIEKTIYTLEAKETFLFNGALQHAYHQIKDGEYITIHIPKDSRIIECLLSSPEH